MAITAADVFTRVRLQAQDEDSVRWSLAEDRLWINDGMRQIVLLKPSAYSTTVVMTLAAGTKQTLASTYMSVLAIKRNMKTNGTDGAKAIRMVERDILDAVHPNWHDTTVYAAAASVKQAVFDPKNPREFYVFPANDGTGKVELTVSSVPTPIGVPTVPESIADAAYTAALALGDEWLNALVDYVLFRNYLKDMGGVGNSARAAAHYKMFGDSCGVKLAMETAMNPNTGRGAAVMPSTP